MTLAERINALLESEIAAPGDGSLLDSALGSKPISATDLAYRRVEILLAAWKEMHRERAPAAISERIWSEPLTENEREIIENVLATGSVDDLRRWLRHVVKVYDARTGGPSPQQIAAFIRADRNAWIAYIESDPSDEELRDASVSSLDRIYAYFVAHGLMEVDRVADAQTQLGAYAEAKADEYHAKAGRARLVIVRRWYGRREAIAREIARSEAEE